VKHAGLTTLLLVFCVACALAAAQMQSVIIVPASGPADGGTPWEYPQTNELVLWFDFATGDETNVSKSALGNNKCYLGTGTAHEMSWGNEGGLGYIEGNGSTDYAECTTNYIRTTRYTLSLWAWINATGQQHTAYSEVSTTDPDTVQCTIDIWATGQAGLTMGADVVPKVYVTVPDVYMATGTWNHLCAVVSTTNMWMYLNGIGTGPKTNTFGITHPKARKIGASHRGGLYWTYLNGRVDDVLKWKVALSSNEVVSIYEAGRQ